MLEVIFGIVAVALIAAWGWRQGFLTGGGAMAASVVGGCVWAGGRWGLGVPLVFFFVASSMVTRWSTRRENRPSSGVARNLRQVAANGTVASLCSILAMISGETRWLYAALCALAAMTGDTWSSEIGRALARRPWDLRTLRQVNAGISGAVSLIGSAAGLVGVMCTSAIGVFLLPQTGFAAAHVFFVICLWAYAAGWIDSFLGASVQTRFRCGNCESITDDRIHCGQPAQRIAGMPGVGNNAVNLLATIFAAFVVIFM